MHLSTATIATAIVGYLTACDAAALTKRAGPNIIKNGDFEAAQPIWNVTPGGSHSSVLFQSNPQIRSAGGVVFGKCNGSFRIPGVNRDAPSIDQTVTVTPNSNYKLSLEVYGFLSPDTLIQVLWNGMEIINAPFNAFPGTPKISAWSPLSATISVGAGETSGNLKIVWLCPTQSSNSIYVDKVSMVKL